MKALAGRARFNVDTSIGLRVSEEDEREGLDFTSHGETAYTRPDVRSHLGGWSSSPLD